MKLKDLILPISISFLLIWGIPYFFGSRNADVEGDVKSGQSFKAPTAERLVRPLLTEVDFVDAASTDALVTVVETPHLVAEFTTHGGAVDKLSFKHHADGKDLILTTFSAPLVTQDREQKAFLIALDQETPYQYALVDHKKEGEIHTITYQAQSPRAIITKTYTIHDASYKINLEVTLEPTKAVDEKGVQARILLPAPLLKELEPNEKIQALIFNERGSLQKSSPADVANLFWFSPSLIGAESRYFIHSMVNDAHNFVQRGYFKDYGQAHLTTILEGPAVKEKATWSLSFYCGPKESTAMSAVDPRLLETLDFGWFAPIARLLLWLLKFLYRFLHNYGFAIVLLTILIKLLLWPLTIKSEGSMKRQAEFQKKLQYVEQRYKDDPEALSREKMALAKKYGFPAAGCLLPILIQIPVLIGLNRVLSSAIELYRAPFFGWIQDLSAKDPYYVLPVLAALGMVVQMATSQKQTANARQHFTSLLFALVIAAVTANLSAGLTLFIAANTWFGLGQTWFQGFVRRQFNW